MSAPRHGTRPKRVFLITAAVVVFALVGASFALAQGPIYTFLAKAAKPANAAAGAKGRKGAISKASRVTVLRLRHRHPTTSPIPLPIPTPPPADITAPETSITSAPRPPPLRLRPASASPPASPGRPSAARWTRQLVGLCLAEDNSKLARSGATPSPSAPPTQPATLTRLRPARAGRSGRATARIRTGAGTGAARGRNHASPAPR